MLLSVTRVVKAVPHHVRCIAIFGLLWSVVGNFNIETLWTPIFHMSMHCQLDEKKYGMTVDTYLRNVSFLAKSRLQ